MHRRAVQCTVPPSRPTLLQRATWIFAVLLLLYPSEGCVCCGADQRTSDLALVVCFWKHFLVLYVPVLWMVSFTEDINEQPWGLHEHPTVQYKQHLSRDHSELWAKFSIEMLYDCRGMWENAVIWKPWICEFFGIPITNPDPDNLALFQRHSLPEYRCWPCPSL